MISKKWDGKVVLIVEDDEVSMEFLKELFEPYKVRLICTHNGQLAIDACKSNPEIQLVLMDVQLPLLNGNDAMKEIKRLRKELPVIAQTAFAMSGDRERYLKDGFDDYISKPINLKEFILIISKYLD